MMPHRYTTTDVVWLTMLRGGSLQKCWRAAEQNAGHRVSRKYVGCLRHELYGLIRSRFGGGTR